VRRSSCCALRYEAPGARACRARERRRGRATPGRLEPSRRGPLPLPLAPRLPPAAPQTAAAVHLPTREWKQEAQQVPSRPPDPRSRCRQSARGMRRTRRRAGRRRDQRPHRRRRRARGGVLAAGSGGKLVELTPPLSVWLPEHHVTRGLTVSGSRGRGGRRGEGGQGQGPRGRQQHRPPPPLPRRPQGGSASSSGARRRRAGLWTRTQGSGRRWESGGAD
jgi:hypothetical protein